MDGPLWGFLLTRKFDAASSMIRRYYLATALVRFDNVRDNFMRLVVCIDSACNDNSGLNRWKTCMNDSCRFACDAPSDRPILPAAPRPRAESSSTRASQSKIHGHKLCMQWFETVIVTVILALTLKSGAALRCLPPTPTSSSSLRSRHNFSIISF